jgi:hypothetical protein
MEKVLEQGGWERTREPGTWSAGLSPSAKPQHRLLYFKDHILPGEPPDDTGARPPSCPWEGLGGGSQLQRETESKVGAG